MSPHDLGLKIADRITIGGVEVRTARPPAGLIVQEHLGLLTTQYLHGQVIYRAAGALYEARAVKTPQGDYLLMFPTNTKDQPLLENCHYAGKATKVNDMVAFRSKDLGKTWTGPTIAFNIDYNQHGFVPLIPRGSKRIYAFGTQPVWNHFVCERGQQENAPIGYRYSDDTATPGRTSG